MLGDIPHTIDMSNPTVFSMTTASFSLEQLHKGKPKRYNLSFSHRVLSPNKLGASKNAKLPTHILGLIPNDSMPGHIDYTFTKNYLTMGILGPFTPKIPLLQAAFPMNTASSKRITDYNDMPKKAFQGIEDVHMFSVLVRKNVSIPVGYLPPVADKPVIILSPGAAARLDEYIPLIQKLSQEGYGVLAYQLSLFDDKFQFIREDKTFKLVENRFLDDLDKISQGLADGHFETTQESNPIKIKPIPYNRQVLAGHSSGGVISSKLISKYGRPYHSLFLLATPISFQDATIRIAKNSTPAWVNFIVPSRWATKAFDNAFELESSLAKVNIPVHYLQGSEDLLVGQSIYKKLHDTNSIFYKKFADYICLPHSAHNQFLNTPEQRGNGTKIAELMVTILSGGNISSVNLSEF